MFTRQRDICFGTLVAAACLLASGCDTISRLTRVATLESLPSVDSMAAALRDSPSIRRVEHIQIPAVTAWSLSRGTIHRPAYDQFNYWGRDNSCGTVQAREEINGTKTLSLSSTWLNRVPKQSELQRARAMLAEVYANLRRHAPQLPPQSALREDVLGIPQ